MSSWPATVSTIADGDNANATTFNAPVRQLSQRTEYLRSLVDGFTTKSVTLLQNVPVSVDVFVGAAVYLDAPTGTYRPAQAVWSSVYGPNGELLPSPVAQAVGVVTALGGGYADVLMLGYIQSQTVADGLLGSGASAGLYFLSELAAGKAVATAPSMSRAMAIYDGEGGLVVLSNAPERVNHFHRRLELTASTKWLEATALNFPGMTIPAGATFGYNIAADTAVTDLFLIYHGEVVIFSNGVLVPSDQYTVNEDNIWWLEVTEPDDPLYIFSYSPFSAGEPLLRAAVIETPDEMTATAENGILFLGMRSWVAGTTAASATAVRSLSGRTANLTPVVSSIQAGPGVTVSDLGDGAQMVSMSNMIGNLLDVDLVNLDNAVESTDGVYTFLTLPAARTASVVGRVPVPAFSEAVSLQARAFVVFRGSTGGCVLSAELVSIAAPGASPVAISSAITVSTDITNAGATVSGNLYLVQSTDPVAVTGGGMVYVKVTATTPTVDKNLFRAGIILETP